MMSKNRWHWEEQGDPDTLKNWLEMIRKEGHTPLLTATEMFPRIVKGKEVIWALQDDLKTLVPLLGESEDPPDEIAGRAADLLKPGRYAFTLLPIFEGVIGQFRKLPVIVVGEPRVGEAQ